MSTDYTVKFHPNFFKDLKKLDNKEKEIVYKQVKKIKSDPDRFKHLHGEGNCYRIRTGNLRIVYCIENKVIWFLVVERRDTVYTIYFKRLFDIKQKLE